MKQFLFKTLLCAGIATTAGISSQAQINLVQDYKNFSSAPIGTFQGINLREAGFSGLFPIAGTNGREFWVCSDRGPNVDAAVANPSACRPTYDKIYTLPNYVPKIHRIKLIGDSIQILRTITIKRPNGTGTRGVLLPTGLGSTAIEEGSTDTVLNCANFSSKLTSKDTFALDAEGIVVDKEGNFWLCEESGASIWKLNQNGVVIARYTPYANLGGAQSVDIQIDTAFKYRKNNRGFESITIAPNGKIYAMIQSPLLYPTLSVGDNSRVHRMLEITPSTGAMRMFVYLNDGVVGTSSQIRLRDWKTGDMAAINDSTFLVLEAAARGGIDIKRLYRISISNATVVNSGLYGGNTVEALVDSTGLAAQGIVAVRKTLVMDLLANGWPASLDKAEGIAILNDSTIFIGNDNDYGLTTTVPDNGIAMATGNISHVIRYSLRGANKLSNFNQLQPTILAGATGPNSSQAPYVIPAIPGVQTTAIMTVGDAVPGYGYRMVGIPDGAGAFDNGNGTFTMLVNHELGNTAGVARAHGARGAFVSKWIFRKGDFTALVGGDLIYNVKLWDPLTSSYSTYNATTPHPTGLHSFGRFCSGELPPVNAFYNPWTGKGTKERMMMNGEETGSEGRGFAHIVTGPEANTSYELPYTGKFSWENAMACPRPSDTTILVGTDDATPGQVYFYIGVKQTTGNEIEKAGLHGGNLWSVAVSGMLTESSAGVPAAGTAFSMINLGQVQNMTGATLNTNSNNAGATNFLRPEDGAWDPNNPADFYFQTTNSFTAPSRLWRLRFTNPGNITQGGTITAVLDGTEGQRMLDNMCFDNTNRGILGEDVGGQTHLGKIWQYNIVNDSFKLIATHDSTRFLSGSSNFLTIDEESSGQLDAQEILGPGMFLLVDQAHYGISGELVEGGQMLAMYNPESAAFQPEVNLKGNNVSIADGDVNTSTGDNTDFAIVNNGTSKTQTFVIENTGAGSLTVTDIRLTGINASEFTLVTPPAFPLTIAAGSSQTISVRFAPLADGPRLATLTVVNSDLTESWYDVAVRGVGGTPEIVVQGNLTTIVDGDATASPSDNTDFGTVYSGRVTTRIFTISNTGTGLLTLTNFNITGVNSAMFGVVDPPALPLTLHPLGVTTLTVKYTPTDIGTHTATLNIASNDGDEANHDFTLQGRSVNALSVSSLPSSSFVNLYPNPTAGDATIELGLKKADHLVITVINSEGRVVMEPIDRKFNAGDQRIKLPTAGLPNGLYYVEIASGSNSLKLTLVVAH